jgi:putative transposase
MANHLRSNLVAEAPEMAIGQARQADVVHRNDQGSQYTSLTLGKRRKKAAVDECGR